MKHLKKFNEIFLSRFRNGKIISKVEECNNPDELFHMISYIYPETKSAKDGYVFNLINSNLENWGDVKESLLNYLSKNSISDIIIYGPTIKKPGKSWFFSTSYIIK